MSKNFSDKKLREIFSCETIFQTRKSSICCLVRKQQSVEEYVFFFRQLMDIFSRQRKRSSIIYSCQTKSLSINKYCFVRQEVHRYIALSNKKLMDTLSCQTTVRANSWWIYCFVRQNAHGQNIDGHSIMLSDKFSMKIFSCRKNADGYIVFSDENWMKILSCRSFCKTKNLWIYCLVRKLFTFDGYIFVKQKVDGYIVN